MKRHPGVSINPVRANRWLLALVGMICVVLGGIGVFIPGLPTTIFLIAASWCFARSCPWLEDRLIRNRFFRPFLIYLQPGTPMPRRARIITIAVMWIAIAISTVAFIRSDAAWWTPTLLVVAGCLGTACVVRMRRSVDAE